MLYYENTRDIWCLMIVVENGVVYKNGKAKIDCFRSTAMIADVFNLCFTPHSKMFYLYDGGQLYGVRTFCMVSKCEPGCIECT